MGDKGQESFQKSIRIKKSPEEQAKSNKTIFINFHTQHDTWLSRKIVDFPHLHGLEQVLQPIGGS